MKVNICGIEHEIVEVADNFEKMDGVQLGFIKHSQAKILINQGLPEQLKKAVICHEIVHGILINVGREDLSDDETLVTCLGNAINQTFDIKFTEE